MYVCVFVCIKQIFFYVPSLISSDLWVDYHSDLPFPGPSSNTDFEQTPGPICEKVCIWLIEVGRLPVTMDCTVPWTRVSDRKRRKWAGRQHSPLSWLQMQCDQLPHSAAAMASLPWWTLSSNKPLPIKLLLSGGEEMSPVFQPCQQHALVMEVEHLSPPRSSAPSTATWLSVIMKAHFQSGITSALSPSPSHFESCQIELFHRNNTRRQPTYNEDLGI